MSNLILKLKLKNFINRCRINGFYSTIREYLSNLFNRIKKELEYKDYLYKKKIYCKYLNCKDISYDKPFLEKQLKMFKFFRRDTSFYDKINVDINYLYDTCSLADIKFLKHDSENGKLYFIYKNKYKIVTDYSVGIIIQIFALENYKFDWTKIINKRKYLVFDLGMNKGFSSMWFTLFDRVERVIGYEINPLLEDYIYENKKLNPKSFDKIDIKMFGLSDKSETKKFFALKNDDGIGTIDEKFFLDYWSGKRKSGVRRMNLVVKDAAKELQSKMDKYRNLGYFLKIDIEGAEYDVFKRLDDMNMVDKFDIIMGETHNGFEGIRKYLKNYEIYDLIDYPGMLTTFTAVRKGA